MVCVELPGISNYLRGEYRRDLGRESHVRDLSRVYRYIMQFAMTLRPVVWHVLPRAQLQSSRRAFATARRRRPGGSHLPGRATRTMRGGFSFAAAAASTAALGARRDGPARGTASPARHPKDASHRARLGYRRRRTTGKVAAAASDDVLDEGKSVILSVVPRVAARRAPLDDPLAPLHPRTARSFSSHIFFFFGLVLGRLVRR